MLKRLLVTASILAAPVAARPDISPHVELVYEGFLTEYPTTYIFCYDLMVEITGEDAFTVFGGPVVGEPWIRLYGGVFFQHPVGSDGPPDPDDFPQFPDLQYDTFYTSPFCWPNVEDPSWDCFKVGFAYAPISEPTRLIADWFLVPDGNDYAGDFTIARFTVIPDDPEWWCAEIDVLVGSREVVPPIQFTWSLLPEGCCPADLDRDNDVDLSDLAQLLANYGTTGEATYWDGDLDGDDDVDLEDLAELLSVYGTACP
jgi:hypothetical protein